MSLYDVLQEWQTFYSVLAGVSATFAGLLFVGLSLHLGFLRREHYAPVRRLGRQTFSSFLFIVIFALVFLIPTRDPLGVIVPLVITGAMALADTMRRLGEDRRLQRSDEVRVPKSGRIYILSALTYLVLIGASVALLFGHGNALYAFIGLLIWQLAWSTRTAWDLLMEVQVSGA